eukprot:5419-Heterococcus_DN1.PRE.1
MLSAVITTDCVPTVIQQAVSQVLQQALQPYQGHANYYDYLVQLYQNKRDALVTALRTAKLQPLVPEGGIFVIADTSAVTSFDTDTTHGAAKYMAETTPACPIMTRDWAFCRWLTVEKSVTAIPPSAFYQTEHKHLAANLARFAFCKEDATIAGAAAELQKLALEQQQQQQQQQQQ